MSLNRPFNPLRLNADITLRHGGGAVLQKALDQGNVISVCLVNLRRIPLAEAVGADALIAQVITGDGKLLLVCPPLDLTGFVNKNAPGQMSGGVAVDWLTCGPRCTYAQ